MELSEATLRLVEADAYAALCREALNQRLADLDHEKEEILGTRPPFGVLARKETRKNFDRAMRDAEDTESGLRERLARLDAIETCLHPRLRMAIGEYLADVSPDYCRFLYLLARLKDWEQAFEALPEVLLGFARDVRSVRMAAAAAASTRDCLQSLGDLSEIATRLDRHAQELDLLTRAIDEVLVGPLQGKIARPVLPNPQRLPWVSRLVILSPLEIAREAARAETETRQFLAEGAVVILDGLELSCKVCVDLANGYLQTYWGQLREHAGHHYVEEKDLDEVLTQLFRDYVEAELAQHRQADTFDPLATR